MCNENATGKTKTWYIDDLIYKAKNQHCEDYTNSLLVNTVKDKHPFRYTGLGFGARVVFRV